MISEEKKQEALGLLTNMEEGFEHDWDKMIEFIELFDAMASSLIGLFNVKVRRRAPSLEDVLTKLSKSTSTRALSEAAGHAGQVQLISQGNSYQGEQYPPQDDEYDDADKHLKEFCVILRKFLTAM